MLETSNSLALGKCSAATGIGHHIHFSLFSHKECPQPSNVNAFCSSTNCRKIFAFTGTQSNALLGAGPACHSASIQKNHRRWNWMPPSGWAIRLVTCPIRIREHLHEFRGRVVCGTAECWIVRGWVWSPYCIHLSVYQACRIFIPISFKGKPGNHRGYALLQHNQIKKSKEPHRKVYIW